MATPPVIGEDPPQNAGPMAILPDVAEPTLPPDTAHHFRRVLRLRDNAPIVVCDGEGLWREALLGRDDVVTSLGPIVEVPKPHSPVAVGFALVKGGKPELICQKLTELGVDTIVAFTAQRSVVSWDGEKMDKQQRRLSRIADEAMMQCRRTRRPNIGIERSLAECLGSLGPNTFVADRDGIAWPPTGKQPVGALVIGPEGGWADGEVPEAVERVRISQHVLRAETAAIAAGVSLTALRGILGQPT